MSIPAIFNRLLQAATKSRGVLGGPVRSNVPRNFSPLGQAPRTAPPVGRATLSSDPLRSIVGNPPTRTGFKLTPGGVVGGSLSALGGLSAINKLRKGDFQGAAVDSMLMAPLPYLAGAAGLFAVGEGLFTPSAGDATLKNKPISLAQDRLRGDRAIQQGGGRTGEAYVGTGLPSEDRLRGDRAIQQGGGRTGEAYVGTGVDFSLVDRSTTPTSDPRNTDLPVSAEQVAPVDPYAYQLSVYGQGRQAANSQEAMDKVRDLGLAINRAQNPQFYRESYNPLMAATFPERYQKTPENFVVQQGIQVPSAMTAKDSRAELLQSEEEANIERLDQSTAAVEAFLANYLNKGAK